jgi:hypothetical protein
MYTSDTPILFHRTSKKFLGCVLTRSSTQCALVEARPQDPGDLLRMPETMPATQAFLEPGIFFGIAFPVAFFSLFSIQNLP